jgi:glycosyltransferase involved in cell wall biosynthesis
MAEAVAELGHEVHIVTYHFGEDIPVRGVHVHRIPALTHESTVVVGPTSRRPLYDLQMVFKAIEVIRRYGCDIIDAHNYEGALVGWLCRMATGLPVVYNGHNTMSDELPTYRFIRPRCLALALGRFLDAVVPRIGDRCVPISAGIARFFDGMGLRAHSEPVLPIGIDVDWIARGDGSDIRPRYGLGDAPVILYSGVTDEFQRLDLLLEGMAHVARHDPRAKLLIVVTVPNAAQLDQLRRQAEALHIADRLVVTEPQPLHRVRDFLAACDIGVSPRPATPGLPVKLINYMAAGKPGVIFSSSAFGGLSHRDNVMMAGPDTGPAFGDAILELIRDPGLRQRIATAASRFVRARHDRRVTARQKCDTFIKTLTLTGRAHLLARRELATPRAADEPRREMVEAEVGRAGRESPPTLAVPGLVAG